MVSCWYDVDAIGGVIIRSSGSKIHFGASRSDQISKACGIYQQSSLLLVLCDNFKPILKAFVIWTIIAMFLKATVFATVVGCAWSHAVMQTPTPREVCKSHVTMVQFSS